MWRTVLQIKDFINIVVGRAQIASTGNIMLLNLYAPSGSNAKHDRNLFFGQDILRALDMYPQNKWFVGGDYNALINPLDVENGTGFAQKKSSTLSDLAKLKNFKDIYRHMYPTGTDYTFYRPYVAPSRLDRFYLSAASLDNVRSIQLIASLSDHMGVLTQISLDVVKPGIPKINGRISSP